MRDRDRNIALAGSLVAIGTLIPVALFQSGAIERLPDPPAEIFDSERITSSKMAHPRGIPDSYLGLASYATTLGLILLAQKSAVAHRLLGVKAALDGAAAGVNAARQVIVFGKICSWCTATALATTLVVYGSRGPMAEDVQKAERAL